MKKITLDSLIFPRPHELRCGSLHGRHDGRPSNRKAPGYQTQRE